jgi:hypothetical protein
LLPPIADIYQFAFRNSISWEEAKGRGSVDSRGVHAFFVLPGDFFGMGSVTRFLGLLLLHALPLPGSLTDQEDVAQTTLARRADGP